MEEEGGDVGEKEEECDGGSAAAGVATGSSATRSAVAPGPLSTPRSPSSAAAFAAACAFAISASLGL